jgi:Porin subfamily
MTPLRSLFLASAAGLVTVAGAQAADMPVKAKAPQYVKICTLYGDGYYYIPGTDTCIKLGGYVRLDVVWDADGGRTPDYAGATGAQDRSVGELTSKARANMAADTRTSTQYGVVRTLASVHFQNQDQADSFNVARAFVQWQGFTFGRMKSYQDTFNIGDNYNIETQQTGSDTGANGVNSIAYTQDLGNGVTLTGGVDERRIKSLTNLSVATALKVGAEPTTFYQGAVGQQTWPDPYLALHIDQSWGNFAVSSGLHDVNASYYSASGNAGGPFAGFHSCGPALANTTACGHPSDKVGYFVELGGELKTPFGPGDKIGAGVRYSVGASGFGGGNNLASPDLFGSGNNAAIGFMTDGVFVNGSSIELTTAWSVQAGYDHHWNDMWNSTLFGGWSHILHNAQAKSYYAGALGCAAGTGATAQTNIGAVAATNTCDPDWSYLEVGTMTRWTPAPNLQISAQVLYSYITTAFNGTAALAAVPGARPPGVYTIGNQGIVSGYFRVQRSYAAAEN